MGQARGHGHQDEGLLPSGQHRADVLQHALHKVGLHPQEEVLAALGHYLVGAVGKAQLPGQGLGPLGIVVGQDAGLGGLADGVGDGAPHVTAADEAKGILHGNHSCLGLRFPPAGTGGQGRGGKCCPNCSTGQMGRQGRAAGRGRKFLVRMEKGEGRRGERFCIPLQGFPGKDKGTCTWGKGRVKFRKQKHRHPPNRDTHASSGGHPQDPMEIWIPVKKGRVYHDGNFTH